MVDNVNNLHPPIGPAKPVQQSQKLVKTDQLDSTQGSFGDFLKEALRKPTDVAFSAHAQKRLSSRGIIMDDSQMSRLSNAVDLVNGKGGQDSLVMLDGLALIVNVPSRTVVTAMEVAGMGERVVTNIDSAVLG